MKRKLTFCFLLLGVAVSFSFPQNAKATGACTSARFHTWQDLGCNQCFAGVGGLSTGKTGAGGNQSSCPTGNCQKKIGMPQWWVHEPYEDMWMSDTPLSYTMSSGQPMNFTFYYHQRDKLPESDEVPGYYVKLRGDFYPGLGSSLGAFSGTNACWGNNWMTSIQFWDSTWENAWINSHSPPGYSPFSHTNYEAFVFRPEGGINYYNQSSLQDPQSQIRLQPVSGSYPMTTGSPSADANGIYWGDAGMGFELVYPDGSLEVFGLIVYSNASYAVGSTARAFLTQRIDPQGRINRVGYEYVAPGLGISVFRVRYVVDPDGRTNTFLYATNSSIFFNPPVLNPWMLTEIDDPYGRKVEVGYTAQLNVAKTLNYGLLSSLTDASGLTSSFQYQGTPATYQYYFWSNGIVYPTNIVGLAVTNNNGWITNLTTPYGNTAFTYYQLPDPTATVPDCYQLIATYVSEPEGAKQLFVYEHTNWLISASETSPTAIPGQIFDNGTSQTNITPHYWLNYRNTFHWGQRQFAALSSGVQTAISGSLSNAVTLLTTNDCNKADLKHWMLGGDIISITESLSSEQDPSPDATGQIPGLRTWYNYLGKPSVEVLGADPQVSCIARILPDGSSQYTTYNFYPITGIPGYPVGSGFVSDNESSYSKPDGTIGVLTNWFAYEANSIDLASVTNSFGQWLHFGYNGNHQITFITNALSQVTALGWDPYTFDLTSVQWPNGQSASLSYYAQASPPTSTSAMISQITVQPEGRVFNLNNYQAGNPSNITDDRGLSVTNSWDGLNRLTGTVFPDGTSVSNIYNRLDLGATKDRLATGFFMHMTVCAT
jgi:hypothetical protein